MKILMEVVFLVAVLGPCDSATTRSIEGCYSTWSRCSEWSSSATGLLWVGCDKCCQCKRYNGGSCNLEPVTNCGSMTEAYQCKCYGYHGGDRPWSCLAPNNWFGGCH